MAKEQPLQGKSMELSAKQHLQGLKVQKPQSLEDQKS